MNDMPTIAQISTPPGYGGISIIRISGGCAFEIINKLYQNPKGYELKSGEIHYGHIIYNTVTLDEVLVSKMKAPHTYTTEDVVEINCHGGYQTAKEVLTAVLALGAKAAEPGEFTRRAFENGRIDLTQAEAISDIVFSKTSRAMTNAQSQLSGKLRAAIESIVEKLIELLSIIEVNIEYPEYDEANLTSQDLLQKLSAIKDMIERLIATYERGEILKEGLKVVIAGRPNVGKSMLLNALVGSDKAIVTEIPGTTRDVIDAYINLDGIPIRFFDTAGIRESDETIEKIGIERSIEAIEHADIVFFVADASEPLSEEDYEILSLLDMKNVIYILNKCDLEPNEQTETHMHRYDPISLSAKTAANLDILFTALKGKAAFSDEDELTLISNLRHKTCLTDALDSIQAAIIALSSSTPIDLLETDIHESLNALGRITGETTAEDIIDEIFSRFCLGK